MVSFPTNDSGEPLIDSNAVHKAMLHVLYREAETADGGYTPDNPPPGCVVVEGLTMTFGFHPERLQEVRAKVEVWLAALPVNFMHTSESKGWTFLNACVDRNEVQWGEQMNVQELMCLGVGLGLVEYGLPRDFWKHLPGGVPYFTVRDDKFTTVPKA